MSRFEKVKEFKTKRFYQKTESCGIFLDIEAHRNKIKAYMGSIFKISNTGAIPPTVQMGEIKSDLLCLLDNKEDIVLKTFENIYQEYANEYASLYIFGDYAPLEDWAGKIETDDISEVKVVRYRYKKFFVDIMTVTNLSEEDNTITYVYILDKKKDFKVLCEFFDYELPEEKYEELLERSIEVYIADFYCEIAGRPYHVEDHHYNNASREEKATNSGESSNSNVYDEYLEEMDETGERMPFC